MKAFTKGLAKKNASIFYLTFHKSNILSFLHLQYVGSILEISEFLKELTMLKIWPVHNIIIMFASYLSQTDWSKFWIHVLKNRTIES